MVHGANVCENANKYFFLDFHFNNIFLHFKYIASGGVVK